MKKNGDLPIELLRSYRVLKFSDDSSWRSFKMGITGSGWHARIYWYRDGDKDGSWVSLSYPLKGGQRDAWIPSKAASAGKEDLAEISFSTFSACIRSKYPFKTHMKSKLSWNMYRISNQNVKEDSESIGYSQSSPINS